MAKEMKYRSQQWFDNDADPGMTAIYLERYFNFGLTMEELRSGKPIIGIAQSGSDLSPCNRIHCDLESRVRDGIRDAGGIPLVFPVHPIQETGRRPTAALDRNLAYLGLVEILHGYPLDGVVLTTGCDKTTPAQLMAAATVNIPAIVLSGGPMLDGFHRGKPLGSGAINWECRQRFAAGEINADQFVEIVADAAPSMGHCNTMGTALTMNSLAEMLGMSLPGCAAIPAPYRQRGQMAYHTGRRIVGMVDEDLRPSDIMTRDAFLNVVAANTLIGGSSNAPVHIMAIAKHMGIELTLDDWEQHGHALPLLVNLQPAGEYLAESFYKAGGVPGIVKRMAELGILKGQAKTVAGNRFDAVASDAEIFNEDIIRPLDRALKEKAGFLHLSGNLFDSGIMKTSVIDDDFRATYLSNPDRPDCFEARVIVFDGPEDYHHRINDPALNIDKDCVLLIRGCGVKGYPGSAEVVNMQPPDALIKAGISSLPTIGDGRQSGTSAAPSILNVTPEASEGGGMALVRSDDILRIDLANRRVDMLVDDTELARRAGEGGFAIPANQTPWQEIYRDTVEPLSEGGAMKPALKYQRVSDVLPRNNH